MVVADKYSPEGAGGTSFRRMRDVGGGIFAEEMVALSPATGPLANGQFYLAGSGRLTLAAAGNIRGTFTNPSGSGRTCYIARLAGMSTATGFMSLRLNPTTGLPATAARTAQTALLGSANAAVGVLKVDTDLATALGGGTDTGIVIGAPANARLTLDMPPLIVPAGVSLGLGVTYAGAAEMALSIYWYEV